jgi:predicted RNA-binding protein YlqC (UPF0109 family)
LLLVLILSWGEIDISFWGIRPDPMIATQEQADGVQLKLRSLLETIVLAIGRRTKVPEIEHYPNEALFTLQVDPHDQGRIIGKLGRTIWAIQTIFWYAGLTQFGWSYSVKLLEPDNPIKERRPAPFKFDPKWNRKKIGNLIDRILETCLRSYCSWSLLETGEASMTVNLKMMKYLRINLTDPAFADAFETVLRVAGFSNGVKIVTEVTWE